MTFPSQPTRQALGPLREQHAEKDAPKMAEDAPGPRYLSSAPRRRQEMYVINLQIRFSWIGAFAQQFSQICGLITHIADRVKQKWMTSYSKRGAQRRSLS